MTDAPRDTPAEATGDQHAGADRPGADPHAAAAPPGVDEAALDASTGPSPDLVRRRRIRRVAGGGITLGLVLSLVAGAAGATGRAGAAILLLLSAAGCAAAATYGVLTAVVDDLRGRPVSRRRLGWVVMMFVAAAALMSMTAGVGG